MGFPGEQGNALFLSLGENQSGGRGYLSHQTAQASHSSGSTSMASPPTGPPAPPFSSPQQVPWVTPESTPRVPINLRLCSDMGLNYRAPEKEESSAPGPNISLWGFHWPHSSLGPPETPYRWHENANPIHDFLTLGDR